MTKLAALGMSTYETPLVALPPGQHPEHVAQVDLGIELVQSRGGDEASRLPAAGRGHRCRRIATPSATGHAAQSTL
jgi:hypothetical protein